ncbi:ABC transporter permease [Nocardioides sp. Iso805N]|uniref:ABC transporter permease n=1 Tax=Nocardioides sp. Iso805N TaxID=1283287 RepID=UPI00037F71BE|nr:ABC transporter permease [Nocardioides sp. Iso805N]
MSTVTLVHPSRSDAPATVRPASLRRTFRFELVKLVAQWRIRLMLLVCLIVPGAFVAAVGQQSSLPADTVFGRQMALTGWAGPLVILAFVGTWALPLLTSLVSGDVFAVEDRLGTWRHLVVAVRSTRRIFAAKALSSLIVVLAMVACLAISATVGGLLGIGSHPLVGLDGHTLGVGDAAGRVTIAWLCVAVATLAYAAIGLLGSVTLGRSPIGLLLPALVALLLQVLALLPLPAAVRMALPSNAFVAWRGLFTSPAQMGPIWAGLAVSVAWAVVATALAHHHFVRRDFTDLTNDGSARRIIVGGLVPLAGLTVVTAVVLGGATPADGSGVTRAKLQDSLSTTFSHLYVLQTDELQRPTVTEVTMRTRSSCDKGGPNDQDSGPGNDWRCIVSWHTPGTAFVGQATFQLDVTADGRYVADGDGPKEVNGSFQVHTVDGDTPNPLWQFDGLVDLLTK